jgi:hypothetical protein
MSVIRRARRKSLSGAKTIPQKSLRGSGGTAVVQQIRHVYQGDIGAWADIAKEKTQEKSLRTAIFATSAMRFAATQQTALGAGSERQARVETGQGRGRGEQRARLPHIRFAFGLIAAIIWRHNRAVFATGRNRG